MVSQGQPALPAASPVLLGPGLLLLEEFLGSQPSVIWENPLKTRARKGAGAGGHWGSRVPAFSGLGPDSHAGDTSVGRGSSGGSWVGSRAGCKFEDEGAGISGGASLPEAGAGVVVGLSRVSGGSGVGGVPGRDPPAVGPGRSKCAAVAPGAARGFFGWS